MKRKKTARVANPAPTKKTARRRRAAKPKKEIAPMATKKRKRTHAKKRRHNPKKHKKAHAHAHHAAHAHAAAPRRRRRHNPKRHHARKHARPRRHNPGNLGIGTALKAAAVGLAAGIAVRVAAGKFAPGSSMAQKGLAAAVGVGAVLLGGKKHPLMASAVAVSMLDVAFLNDVALRAEIALAGGPVERARVASRSIAALGSGNSYMDLNGLVLTSGDIQGLVMTSGDIQGVMSDDMGAVASDLGDTDGMGDAIDRLVSDMGDPFFGGDSITG